MDILRQRADLRSQAQAHRQHGRAVGPPAEIWRQSPEPDERTPSPFARTHPRFGGRPRDVGAPLASVSIAPRKNICQALSPRSSGRPSPPKRWFSNRRCPDFRPVRPPRQTPWLHLIYGSPSSVTLSSLALTPLVRENERIRIGPIRGLSQFVKGSMKRLTAVLVAMSGAFFASCATAKHERPYQVPPSLNYLAERVMTDFDLAGVERLPTGYINPLDLNRPLRAKFPASTPRKSVEEFLAGRTWASDVVIKRKERSLEICYYQVKERTPWVVQRDSVWIRFTIGDLVESVWLRIDVFIGGRPAELPDVLLPAANSAGPDTT